MVQWIFKSQAQFQFLALNLKGIWLSERLPRNQPQHHIPLHPLGPHKSNTASSWGLQSTQRHRAGVLQDWEHLPSLRKKLWPPTSFFHCGPIASCFNTSLLHVLQKGANRDIWSSTVSHSWSTVGAKQSSCALPSLPCSEHFGQYSYHHRCAWCGENQSGQLFKKAGTATLVQAKCLPFISLLTEHPPETLQKHLSNLSILS